MLFAGCDFHHAAAAQPEPPSPAQLVHLEAAAQEGSLWELKL